jgi:hypothetical protein
MEEDYGYSDNDDEDYHFSDQEDSELELLQNDLHNFQLSSSKASIAQVFPFDFVFIFCQ